jgi:hypothetical protein
VRVYVAEQHRRSDIAITLAITAREILGKRFVSGEDLRGAGMLFEVENEILKTVFDRGHWRRTQFDFIAERPWGDHVRVHYFPGALAPEPR